MDKEISRRRSPHAGLNQHPKLGQPYTPPWVN
jgi:hypothetical protein